MTIFVFSKMFRLQTNIFPKVRHFSFRKPYETGTETIDTSHLLKQSENALRHKDYFKVEQMVSLNHLFENKVHIGHNSGKLHQEMQKYTIGTMDGISIIDLDKTLPRLKLALNFVSHVVYRNGIVLFVNERPFFSRITQETARECGEYFVTSKWAPGTFSNYGTYLDTVPYPGVVILFNCVLSSILIKECESCCIPVVAICDTDTDPDNVMYPVPGNDDTTGTILFYYQLFKRAVIQAKEKRAQDLIRAKSRSDS